MDDFPRIPNILNLFCWPATVRSEHWNFRFDNYCFDLELTYKNILLRRRFILSLSRWELWSLITLYE